MARKRRSKLDRDLVITILVLAFIILPTGTPEDIITNIPLIALIGVKAYIILCIILLFAVYQLGYSFPQLMKKGRRMFFKRK